MQAENNSRKSQDAKLHFLDYWRIIRIRKAVILVVFLLVVLTTSLVSVFLTPTYSSTARIAIKKDSSDIAGLLGFESAGQYDPYWMSTEFEKIQSKKVIYPVITELALGEKWKERYRWPTVPPKDQLYSRLLGLIDIKQYQNTSFIEITAYSEDRQEATDIANGIAESYKKIRLESMLEYSDKGIEKLRESLATNKVDTANKREEIDEYRKEQKIADILAPEGNPRAQTVGPQILVKLEMARTDIKIKFSLAESLYKELDSLSNEQLRRSAVTLIPNNIRLHQLISKYDNVEQLIINNPSNLGEQSERWTRLLELGKYYNDEIACEVEATLAGLESQVSLLRDQLNQMDQLIEVEKEVWRNNDERYRPYYLAKRELEQLQQHGIILKNRIYQEEVESQLPMEAIVETYDEAEASLRPVRPNIALNVALGVIVGLIAGVGLAFFIEYLDTSVKTIDDVEQALEAPVLGVIPQNVGSLLEEGPDSPHAEAYRVLRTGILFSRKDEKLNTMTVVSGGAGEGKSTTIFNLATVFAQNEKRILLVDSDLRRPSLHKILGVSNARGLTNYLLGEAELDEVVQTTKLETMDFLPSGKLLSSSMGILNSEKMKSFIKEMKGRYDYVLFDSPPIMGVSDASILTSEVDMALLVVQYRKYPQAMTIRAKQMVEKVGQNLLGVVLNNINISQDSYYYYYSGYYYDYYAGSEEAGKPEDGNGEPPKEPSAVSGRQPLDLGRKY